MIGQPGPPAAEGRRRLPRWRDLSLEHKLPLLMTAVLVVVLGAALLLTHVALARAAEVAARGRFAGGGRQIASSVENANRERAGILEAIARHPDVRQALARTTDAPADVAAARLALRGAVASHSDSALALLLLDARGRPVTVEVPAAAADSAMLVAALRVPAATDRGPPGATRFTRMYAAGTRMHYWAIAPVMDRRRVLGHVAQLRRVDGRRDGSATLSELLGAPLTLYLRNLDGSGWSAAPGTPVSPPTRRDSTAAGVVHERPDTGPLVTVEDTVAGSPWVVVLESRLADVTAPADAALNTLLVISTLLIAAGAALSGIISRGLTRPLTGLTAATAGVVRGEDGAAPGVAHGGDEIGRLAASFSRMAAEVADARRELERRVDEAQASATALERANDRLQQAIRDAEHARREAERANRAKSDFLAVMSHELRTPLNAIGGYTQLLELGIYGAVSDAQRDTLGRITRNQTHLLRLINDVLNFAKIDAGQVEYAIGGVPLDDALAGVEALVAPQMRAKRITFSYAPPAASVVVRADRERLQQIVLNLLVNAVKFTAPGGTVAVACEAGADVARICVRDSGVGIPAERLGSIFDPFVQGDRALNRPNEGVGLGLAISRDLARGMGGELTVESAVGEGSTFTVTLPRAGVEAHGGPGVAAEGTRALTRRP